MKQHSQVAQCKMDGHSFACGMSELQKNPNRENTRDFIKYYIANVNPLENPQNNSREIMLQAIDKMQQTLKRENGIYNRKVSEVKTNFNTVNPPYPDQHWYLPWNNKTAVNEGEDLPFSESYIVILLENGEQYTGEVVVDSNTGDYNIYVIFKETYRDIHVTENFQNTEHISDYQIINGRNDRVFTPNEIIMWRYDNPQNYYGLDTESLDYKMSPNLICAKETGDFDEDYDGLPIINTNN